MRALLVAVAALLVFAAPARAGEQLLTLYSPAMSSEPYVHKSTTVVLKADGVGAPNPETERPFPDLESWPKNSAA